MILSSIIFLANVLVFGNTTPILEGADTGLIIDYNGQIIVLNSGQFPYVVHLSIETMKQSKINPQRYVIDVGVCAGALIKEDVILTAGHCLDDTSSIQEIVAWAGIVDTVREKDKGQKIVVKNYKRHENYRRYHNGIYLLNDIAILWLKSKFKTDGKFIKLATLPERKSSVVEKRGYIIGWGLTTCGVTSPMLQKATVRAISQLKCMSYYKTTIISDRVVCIMSDQQVSTNTQGDSGGPFIVNGNVVGLCSFAAVDKIIKKDGHIETVTCNPRKPGVYTKVSKYIDWINKQLEDGPPVKVNKKKVVRKE